MGKLILPSYDLSVKPSMADIEWRDDHPLAEGCVGFWAMAAGAGFTAYDSSPFGNDGALTNMDGTDWVPSPQGGALAFDGTPEYVTMGTGTALRPTSATVMVRAKYMTGQVDAHAALVHHVHTESKGFELVIRMSDAHLWWATTGGWAINDTGYQVTLSQWNTYALTSDPVGGVRVYVNGAQVDYDGTATGNLTYSAASAFAVGARIDADTLDPFIHVESAALWSRALTPNEIQTLYVDPHALLRTRRRVIAGAGAAPPVGDIVVLRRRRECA